MNKVRFGIIGCSRIAERSVIPAILNSEYTELKIIGSRSKEKGNEFCKKFNCHSYGTYEEVLESKNVDAVYISLPIGLHEEWAIKAAKSGKHILCEKSSSTSYISAVKMVNASRQNKVRLMEAFMFRFHPQHKKVLELIRDGTLGSIFSFYGSYGFPPVSPTDIRYNASLGGGVLNETGCYPIYASRLVMNEEPLGVMCNLYKDNKKNVDVKGHLYLLFNSDKAAQISFSFEQYYQANYKIWGTKGILELKRAYAIPPDLPATIFLQSNNTDSQFNIEPADHFLLMVNAFCNEILDPKSHYSFENDLLAQARIMQAARMSNVEKRFVYIDELTDD
jgi:predicted dehydrogenase